MLSNFIIALEAVLPIFMIMGIGMLMAVPAGQAEQTLAVLKEAGEAAYQVGTVVSGDAGVELK